MAVQAKMVGVDPVTGETVEDPYAALEEGGVAFDPTTQHLDLSKEEKRRTTALMLAIQGYKELIIKDHLYLRELNDIARRNEGPKLREASINAMVDAAIQFDHFIAGGYSPVQAVPPEVAQEADKPSDEPTS